MLKELSYVQKTSLSGRADSDSAPGHAERLRLENTFFPREHGEWTRPCADRHSHRRCSSRATSRDSDRRFTRAATLCDDAGAGATAARCGLYIGFWAELYPDLSARKENPYNGDRAALWMQACLSLGRKAG